MQSLRKHACFYAQGAAARKWDQGSAGPPASHDMDGLKGTYTYSFETVENSTRSDAENRKSTHESKYNARNNCVRG